MKHLTRKTFTSKTFWEQWSTVTVKQEELHSNNTNHWS